MGCVENDLSEPPTAYENFATGMQFLSVHSTNSWAVEPWGGLKAF